MTKLLGGQIMFGDFLYVHLSTPSTVMFECEKTSQMFGLTITDNGNGQVSSKLFYSHLINFLFRHLSKENDQTVSWNTLMRFYPVMQSCQ